MKQEKKSDSAGGGGGGRGGINGAERGVKQPQSKMRLLLVRTSSLALLLGLVAGVVATATAHQGTTCRQEIPAALIRELWSRTRVLINKLPVRSIAAN